MVTSPSTVAVGAIHADVSTSSRRKRVLRGSTITFSNSQEQTGPGRLCYRVMKRHREQVCSRLLRRQVASATLRKMMPELPTIAKSAQLLRSGELRPADLVAHC